MSRDLKQITKEENKVFMEFLEEIAKKNECTCAGVGAGSISSFAPEHSRGVVFPGAKDEDDDKEDKED